MAQLLFTFDASNVRATAAHVWADPDYQTAAAQDARAAAAYALRAGEPRPDVRPTTEADVADRLCDEAVEVFRKRWGGDTPPQQEAVTPEAVHQRSGLLHDLSMWRGLAVTFVPFGDFDAPNPRPLSLAQGGHHPARLVDVPLPFGSTVREVSVVFRTKLR